MTKPRVIAPQIVPGEKLSGPVSYFPSIEKKYGRPLQEWLDLASARLESDSHMEVVIWLKQEYGLGHGHSNSIVAYIRAAWA